MVDLTRSARTYISADLQDQHVRTWLTFQDQHMVVHVDLTRSAPYMVDLTRSARTWLILQDQHTYKVDMVDLTRSARTWLTLQDQHVHG